MGRSEVSTRVVKWSEGLNNNIYRSYELCVIFWVFPRRLIIECRRFGTLYLFHLQRLDMTSYPAFEDGKDKVFRNVGIQ